jgi:hypothetical protein
MKSRKEVVFDKQEYLLFTGNLQYSVASVNNQFLKGLQRTFICHETNFQ